MNNTIVTKAFAMHSASLHRFATRMTGDPDLAEDLVQETFVRYSAQEGEIDSEKAWLFRVISNLALGAHNTSKRRFKLLRGGKDRQPIGDPALTPEELYEKTEIRDVVRGALDRLSERDQTLLLMREEGFSHAEIADAIDSTTKSVGTLLARALLKVATHLEDVKEELA
jgi:RNA polymerase sigma-70 factor (ECF subfamily)